MTEQKIPRRKPGERMNAISKSSQRRYDAEVVPLQPLRLYPSAKNGAPSPEEAAAQISMSRGYTVDLIRDLIEYIKTI
jgi:hypothetical protein